ncbi:hypothetical protein [Priestia megaterium]|uniref:hypothetical protein n=1 Tax=Priestia megaterium TaxID=1404 RepID=UPI000BF75237|nr:hypothetical protein [Priestia megaterium]PFK62641.1 hypothetical protein COJ21_27200 [Priestia megaterium]PFT56258.1 hypothetical protein COK68_10410 [Priestia megaterium]
MVKNKVIETICWLAILALLILSIVVNVVYKGTKQTLLFTRDELKSGEVSKSWESFRKEQQLSQHKAKIEDFRLTLDRDQNISSMRFTVIDPSDDNSYTMLDYSSCFLCEDKGEDRLTVTSDKVDRKPAQYDRLMTADEFFLKVETLNNQHFFTTSRYAYTHLHSSGEYENTSYDGPYFILEGTELKQLQTSHSLDKDYRNYGSIQVIGSNSSGSYQTSEGTTESIIIR